MKRRPNPHRLDRKHEKRELERAQALLHLGTTEPDEVQLRHAVADHVVRVMDACSGNISLTAELLGIPRRTLQRMFKRGLRTTNHRRKR